jgi:hypothetical protein
MRYEASLCRRETARAALLRRAPSAGPPRGQQRNHEDIVGPRATRLRRHFRRVAYGK